jgi:hypothetical protein
MPVPAKVCETPCQSKTEHGGIHLKSQLAGMHKKEDCSTGQLGIKQDPRSKATKIKRAGGVT